jgi:ribonuclease R
MTAERESIKYKQMEYLKEKLGRSSRASFRCDRKRHFVELEESRAEGLISFRTMHGGFYMTAPYTAGSKTGEIYHIGQPVNVRIKKIDMNLRQMDLEMIGKEDSKPKPIKVKGK